MRGGIERIVEEEGAAAERGGIDRIVEEEGAAAAALQYPRVLFTRRRLRGRESGG